MKQKMFVFILMVSLILAANAGAENEAQWLWGEVSSVDPQKGEIAVRYLDYETEGEKEAIVKIEEKTTYENLSSILDIKPSDTLSIDYMVSPEGAYIAENISLEMSESIPEPQEAPQMNPSQENPLKEDASQEQPQ